ncbi:hypothetical protein EW146_g5628 [Bondarzewia mesenterica]|uniref:GINS subunit domain-containing protein n=1 Tax=Bondarzewia mesenterica TaxID=1095465 RepID=A0A4S4LQZ5_9AGAM|nr:hypothetical protein EW146_g5628 [Bondarzewia mesenterica]
MDTCHALCRAGLFATARNGISVASLQSRSRRQLIASLGAENSTDLYRSVKFEDAAMAGNPLFDDDDPMAVPSFIQRALHAPDDDDLDLAIAPRNRDLDLFTTAEEETELQQLIRHWMNERHAPDILPGQEVVLSKMLDHIRRQSEIVLLLRSDPDTSEDEHFRIMLAQTEIERVKFIVRSYLRIRLHKIEKYARYIAATPEIQTRLSQTEVNHAKRYAKLTEDHFHISVLRSLPEHQQSLDDSTVFTPPMSRTLSQTLTLPSYPVLFLSMRETNVPPYDSRMERRFSYGKIKSCSPLTR